MFAIFFVTVIIIFLINIYFYNGDIIEPSVLLSGMFVVVLFIATSQYKYWQLYNYSSRTVRIFLIGICSFCVGCFIAKKIKIRLLNRFIVNKNYCLQSFTHISLNKYVVFVLVIFSIAAILCFLVFYFRNGFSSLAVMISNFKTMFRVSVEDRIPTTINLLIKVMLCNAYIVSA